MNIAEFNGSKLASLDKILKASSRRQQLVIATPPTPLDHPQTPTTPDTHPSNTERTTNRGLDFSFGFDEDDSDMEEANR